MVHIELVAIDDDPFVLKFIDGVLAQPGLRISRFDDPAQGWETIQRVRPDIVLLDPCLQQMNGMELLERIVEFNPAIEVVVLSRDSSAESAVEAIQKGACDYLTKPITAAALRNRIDMLVAAAVKRRRNTVLELELREAGTFGEMIGRSPAMYDVFAQVRKIAPQFRSVLVTGETGTGKELVARALHQLAPVRGRPFVVCNCAAITETLFESEFFGHVRGSFTGASQDRIGHFESADGGTLFLDEIGEVPVRMQAKFLRVLQSGEIQRVGSSTTRRVNLRVIAATNRNLREMVRTGEFRADLFYRLSTLEIELPTLVDRKEDLPLLCKHFVAQFAKHSNKDIRGLTRRAQMLLSRYSWPGNIRELENVIGHACVMTETDLIDIADLPQHMVGSNDAKHPQVGQKLEEVENRHVRHILDQTGGNKQLAAEILGISRATLYRFLSPKEANPVVRQIA